MEALFQKYPKLAASTALICTMALGCAAPKPEELAGVARIRISSLAFSDGGPKPPPGPPHTYRFQVFALDTVLELKSGANRSQLEKAMERHIIGAGILKGKFGR